MLKENLQLNIQINSEGERRSGNYCFKFCGDDFYNQTFAFVGYLGSQSHNDSDPIPIESVIQGVQIYET